MQKNNAIEFYRFLFSLIVCMFHFRTYAVDEPYPFDSGYLAVEFFFLLSGVFLAQGITARKRNRDLQAAAEDSIAYFFRRFKRLYPHYVFTVICIAVLRIFFIRNLTPANWFQKGISEMIMIQALGRGNLLSLALWFPSALVLASFCVYFLMSWSRSFCKVLFPVAAFGILSSLLQANNSFNVTFSYHFIFSDGFWRALAEIMLGCTCYEIIVWARGHLPKDRKILFMFAELGLLGILLVMFYLPRYREKDYVMLILLSLFIILLMGQTSALSNLLNNRGSAYLGKISYAVYLNQIVIYLSIFKFYPSTPDTSFFKSAVIYLCTIIGSAMITTWLMEKLLTLCSKHNKSFSK